MGTRVGSGFGGGYDYQASTIGNEKVAMQQLNDRLASYLEKVHYLETANRKLEIKILETTEKRGPLEMRDYRKYSAIIEELRAKILDKIKGNAQLTITLDNASLASDDFRVKMEYELSMRQTVEADVARLRKCLDDLNVNCLHLESDIESLKEELIHLKKNHENEVAELRAQITQASIRVDVDAPKGQDLARIMEEIREKYAKIVQNNQQEIQAWIESQMIQVQVQVTESTTALKEAVSAFNETRRRHQALEIELQSAHSLNASLETTRQDIEMCYNMEVEKCSTIILKLQEELTKIRADIHQHTREYEHLLDIKVKLEVEITEYRRLLDNETDLKLEDAVEHKIQMMTLSQTLVDGKVVTEMKDVKTSEK